MKKYLILGLLVVSAAKFALAQDPHFSQIQYNPLYLNPALAGVTEYGKANRLAGLYRDQWRTLPVPYSTTTASYDRVLKKFPKGWLLGGGVSFLYDKAGDGNLSIFNPNLTMNFGKYFNSDKQLLTLGITAGITVKSLDALGLQFDNQYNGSSFDPNLPNGETFSNNNVSYPNFTLGLNFRTKIKEKSTLDIGGSTSNLHQPNQNFLFFTSSKLPARHSAYAKAKVAIKDNWNVQPGVFFQNQKKANQVLVNAIAEVRFSEKKDFGVGFGAGYRAIGNDAAIAYLSFLYKTLRIGAAYDFNVSGIRKATKSQGAFELALNYEFGEVKTKKCPKCPVYVPANVETKVRIRYEDSTNNLVDTVLNQIIPADTVPHQYIDSIELVLKPISLKTDNPTIVIKNTTEKIMSMLPIELYFDNDIPKANSDANYADLYTSYKTRQPVFASKSVDGNNEVGSFFSQIDKNYSRVDEVARELSSLVDSGYVITLEFRGYTSPLATEAYNKKLSERRISSIIKFFDSRLGDNFKILAKSALAIPFGETMSPKEISDSGKDRSKSEFGIAASKQRKVEIVGIRIEKP
ncbi:MAG: PorP/SprF family type IX secretion system membrane protein [Sphingobacteriales bacterium]|nr:PorP/SprF family type IX secretion system membrane protein [Sphingobacteriales bacterium]